MSQPQIKGWFGEWTPTTHEHAIEFAKMLYNGMTCPDKRKIDLINSRHLKGVEFHADR